MRDSSYFHGYSKAFNVLKQKKAGNEIQANNRPRTYNSKDTDRHISVDLCPN
jgi:hypothetical protein